jgi:hypothetical protein
MGPYHLHIRDDRSCCAKQAWRHGCAIQQQRYQYLEKDTTHRHTTILSQHLDIQMHQFDSWIKPIGAVCVETQPDSEDIDVPCNNE